MLKPQTNAHRWKHSLDGLWAFRVQSAEDDATAWPGGFDTGRVVAVPASFNEQFTDYDTYNHMGKVWYARTFIVPDAWRRHSLEIHFAAVNYKADVYLNGEHVGSHETGYTPFSVPANAALVAGENLLVVRVDCELTPRTLPQGGFDKAAIPGLNSAFTPCVNFDFFPYSGIHRHVSLVASGDLRTETLYIDPAIDGSDGVITVRGTLRGTVESVQLTVDGTDITCKAALEGEHFTAVLRIPNARLWDIWKPNLYTLSVELEHGGQVVDCYRQPFGVRTIRVEGDTLLLNGHPVYLKGFGKHEDFPVLGRNHPDAVNVRDLELLRWIGANSFRTSHYPYATEMLELADQLGVLVISETPAVSLFPLEAGDAMLELHCQALRELMRRDYNHPSVVLWSVANEPHSNDEAVVPYFEKVFATAREEDSTRPVFMVMCHFPDEPCHHLCDIIGLNTYPGWYGGGDRLDRTADYFRGILKEVRSLTGKPILVTEIGGGSITGLHSLPSSMWTEDYQSDLIECNMRVMRETPYVIGEHIWAFADFHTAQNHSRAHGNRKGVFTRDRQPKAAAHTIRSLWNPQQGTQ